MDNGLEAKLDKMLKESVDENPTLAQMKEKFDAVQTEIEKVHGKGHEYKMIGLDELEKIRSVYANIGQGLFVPAQEELKRIDWEIKEKNYLAHPYVRC